MDKHQNAHILLVEDDRVSRRMIQESLSQHGFKRIHACETMQKAYQTMNDKPIEIALLDIGLPDGSGVELLKMIREKNSQIALPVVMISSDAESDNIVHCLEMGANDFISKPIDISVLIARVSNLLLIRTLDVGMSNANERFSLAAKGSNDGLWDWYIASGELFISTRWKKMLGLEEVDLESDFSTFVSRIHEDDVIDFNRALRNHLDGLTDYFENECRMQHNDGSYRWIMVRGTAIRHDNGKPYRMAGSTTDITRRKVLDPLTLVLNRSAFLDKIELLINAREKQQIEHFALVLVTIDRFKLINDSFGHHFGDRLILEITNTLNSALPPSVSLARIDSDKFGFAMEQPDSLPDLLNWVQNKIIKPMKVPVIVNERELHLTFSAAVLYETEHYHFGQDIMRDAEIALHDATIKPDTKISVFQSKLHLSLKDRVELEEDMYQGLEAGEFKLHYQPKVDKDGRIIGAEGLVRWHSKRRGMVSPLEFISVAEETGQIIPLGKVLFTQLCQDMAKWRKNGLATKVAFNLSLRQFLDVSLGDWLLSEMRDHELDEEQFELEITESVMMQDNETTVGLVQELSHQGFHLAIDDFGTGYSSLSHLKQLPFSTLKIDKSFIDEVPNKADSVAIVKAILFIADAMKMTVVAEGVETQEQWQFLAEQGVNSFQGYHFYKPMPEEAFFKLLKSQHKKDSEDENPA